MLQPNVLHAKSLLNCFLRTHGLQVVNVALRQPKDCNEMPKVVLERSFWKALVRSSIHLAPVAVQVFLLVLHNRAVFFGPGVAPPPTQDSYLALFKVGAKVLELFWVAGLATILLQALRHELLGDGVPIGLLGSPLWFRQLSTFFSPDFIASIPHFCSWRKSWFLILLALLGLIVAAIGPATAVLLLPRYQTVPADGTRYFLNGTADQFWPSTLTADSEPEFGRGDNAMRYAVCPSGDYAAWHATFAEHLSHTHFCTAAGDLYTPKCRLKYDPEGYTFLVGSMEPKAPSTIAKVQIRPMNAETTATQPHLATVLVQQELLTEWYRAAASYSRGSRQRYASFRWAFNTIADGSTINPYVRPRCTPAQDLSTDPTKAGFYYLLDQNTPLNAYGNVPWSATPCNVSIASLDRAANSRVRTQWIRVPVTADGGMPAGPSFVGFRIDFPTNDVSRVAIACSIDTAWEERTYTLTASLPLALGASIRWPKFVRQAVSRWPMSGCVYFSTATAHIIPISDFRCSSGRSNARRLRRR